MRYRLSTFIKISLLLSSLGLYACKEDLNKSVGASEILFTAKTIEWSYPNEDVDDSVATTRAEVNVCGGYDIPLISDDGEVFNLTVNTENKIEDDTLFQSVTRSAQKTSFTASSEKILVTAFVTGDGVSDYPMIDNEAATLTANGSGVWKWTTPSNYTWPSPTQVITFYGVFPSTNANKIDTKNKFVSVTVPTLADNQQDLLVAATDYLNLSFDGDKAITLPFKHVMTAIKINTGTGLPAMTINKIELKNFYNTGTYTVHDGKWSLGETTSDFSVVPSNTSVNSTTNRELVGGSKTFMMLPQKMSDKMEMVITATYNGKQRTLRASFSGMNEWQAGQTITFTLGLKSGSGYYLYPTDYVGNNNACEPGLSYWPIAEWTIYMTSYKLNTSGSSSTRDLLPWKVTHYARQNPGQNINSSYWKAVGAEGNITLDTNESRPKMTFANNTASTTTYLETTAGLRFYQGTGYYETSTSRDANNKIGIRTQNPRPKLQNFQGRRKTDSETMTAATAKTDYDLSTKGGTIAKTTANCYIVTAPGTYKFPTVYGNGYKNGDVNYQAFKSTNTESGTNLFTDYKGTAISSPDIDVPSGARAVLLWESNGISSYQRNVNEARYWQIPVRDAQTNNNVTTSNPNTSLYYENGYIYFKVQKIRRQYDMWDQFNPPYVIEPGNAVIALVTSDNKIIWAWHIYMAKDELGSAGSTSPEDRNLGQIYRWYTWTFDDRYLWFKVQQFTDNTYTKTTPATPSIIKFRLYYNTPRTMNQRYSCLYQFGRPFPLPEKYLNGNYFCTKQRADNTVRSNEITDFFDATNGSNFTYPSHIQPAANRWLDAKKTIYDPCPVGWRVPPSSTYSSDAYKTKVYSSDEDGWKVTSNNNQVFPAQLYGTTWYLTSTNSGTSNCYGWTFTAAKAPSLTTKANSTEGYLRPIKE